MDSETLQYARYYLSKGLHPIPLAHKTKKPPVCRGGWDRYKTKAPTDAELVEWFARGDRNVAIVLGRRVIAVDFDGAAAEQLLADAGVELPEDAPRSKTSNGFHVLLSVPEPIGNRVAMLKSKPGKPKAQVDVRGEGGYIVVAPSIHPSGAAYEWVQRPDAIPPAPEELLNLIKNSPGMPQDAPAAGAAGDVAPKWVSKALQGVGEGLRDQTCARLAGYFIGKGIPKDVVKEQLYGWAARCTPAFPRAEVDKTVTSIERRDAPAAGEHEAGAVSAQPFQILGYNQGAYFYLPAGSKQVVELRTRDHTKLQLLALAPMAHWERAFPGPSGPKWDLAANSLIQRAHAAGVYDTARIRGRGAWWDDGRAVLHLGDRILVDSKEHPIDGAPRGRYIYEAAAPMPVDLADPLSAEEAYRFVELCGLLSWERPISAKLLAGWVAVAPVCGALAWRPHVWLTGPAGSGKTWVVDHLMRRVIGDIGLAVQSETTEAGLRQTLGHDARPVIFDEAEGENERAQLRIQNILALMRQASSESGSAIIKGSATGAARTYHIRSCFAFSSIGVGVQQHADATRVTVLSLRRDDDPARFPKLQQLRYELLTPEWIRRLHARLIRMIPVIRINAQAFATAGAARIGSQRLGDQVGALLAGTYALYSDEAVTPAAATEWMARQDWSEQEAVTDTADEATCLQTILEHLVRVETKTIKGERSIGELVELARGSDASDTGGWLEAGEILARIGIRIRGTDFVVASNHSEIQRILARTPWSRGWGRMLQRLPGAAAIGAPIHFAGIKCRGVAVPYEVVE